MSLNSCTLNSFTVNTFCSPRRGILFNNLVEELHPPIIPVTGTNPRVLRDVPRIHRPFEIENDTVHKFEQPIVSVTVELFGFIGTDTQEVSASSLDFVTVTGFDLGEETESEVHVNITDLRFE